MDLIASLTQKQYKNALKWFEVVLTVIIGNHVQTVEQLPFVFMDSLDLNVEHGVWVDLHLVVLFQVYGKLQLIFLDDQNIDSI